MKTVYRYISFICICVLLLCSLTGCAQKKTTAYQTYVQNILDVNYKAIYEGYVEAGGAETDAISMYHDCVANLSSQLISHYNLSENLTTELNETLAEIAQTMYANVMYEVSEAYKEDGSYYVDVIIYPLDTLNQAYNDILDYIDQFNLDIDNGIYNDFTQENYNKKFANGITNILLDNLTEPAYQDGIVIQALIEDDGKYYSISEDSLAAIDAMLIAAEDEDAAAVYADETSSVGRLITEDEDFVDEEAGEVE